MKFKTILFFSLSFVYVLFGQNSNLRNGVFLAHSTGTYIWGPNGSQTSIPQEIGKYNQSHNFSSVNEFKITKEDWPINPWTNEWVRWHQIFDGQDTVADIQPYLDNFGLIIIKSCYPSSGIGSWGSPSDTLEPDRKTVFNYKWHWRSFIRKMALHPNIFFSVWTNAPMLANRTDYNEASLSDKFSRWAKDTLARGLDPEFGPFPKNVYVFDFFHKLAGADGKLPLHYAVDSTDNHPNAAATELVAPQFVKEILDAVLIYDSLTPVELNIFSASIINNQVHLNWETTTELNNYGFEIERSELNKNEKNYAWEKIGFLAGFGNSSSPIKYSFVDQNPPDEILYYRLKQINYDGSFEYSSAIEVRFSSIFSYSLKQNYPNPFNPSTIIEYSIPENIFVKIYLYDLLGNKIKIIENSFKTMGQYKVQLNIKDLSSGIYFYRMETKNYKNSMKLILMK